MSNKGKNHVYGPVPSRRLGLSLGVDLVPYKVCSYDCIYCQIGRTKEKTIKRKPYIPRGEILAQLCQKLKEDIFLDFITLAGSGEPTLNSDIESLISDIKKHTKIPVAVLTNASLFWDSSVRQSIMQADVVLPSLDAYDQQGFERINRPHHSIKLDAMAEGLMSFRKEYLGEIWLEMFVLEGINATESDAIRFKSLLEKVNPKKIHINTAIRPTAEAYARPVPHEEITRFSNILGERAEIIAPFSDTTRHIEKARVEEGLLDLLARRPCTLEDISSGLNVHQSEILKRMEPLIRNHTINMMKKDCVIYYQSKNPCETQDT